MAKLQILESANLTIAPFTESDISDRYISWLNDPEIVRYSEQRHRIHTRESCISYLNVVDASPNYFCAIRLKSGGEHIGNILANVDFPNRTADLGILIGERSAWGKGFGFDAWSLLMQELLVNQRYRKVTGGCMSENQGMIAVMKRAGMRHEYTRLRTFLLDGREVDCVHYAAYSN